MVAAGSAVALGALVVLMLFAGVARADATLAVRSLTTNSLTDPLGVDNQAPTFGWVVSSTQRGETQAAYRIRVATSPSVLAAGHGDVWDSGEVTSGNSTSVTYGGPALTTGTRYYWEVQVTDQSGHTSAWSAPAHWQMGLLSRSDWGNAQWIGAADPSQQNPQPAPYVRGDFQVSKPVARATLYITALGFYDASINGREVTPNNFEPGLTNFPSTEEPAWAKQSIEYQSYDVSNLLHQGPNVIGSLLACGFYCGYIPAPQGVYDLFGTKPWLLAHLTITYTDGTTTTFDSGPSWHTHTSPITSTDLYMGEHDDARLAIGGWNTPATSDADWTPVAVNDSVAGDAPLDSRTVPGVQTVKEIHPISMTEPSPGIYVYNLGQNIAGWPKLTAQGTSGTTITLTYGEQLNPDGTVYNANYRLAKSTDQLTLAGTGSPETLEPSFTSHGFQYIEVQGYPGTPSLSSVVGVVAHTPLPQTGAVSTSNPLINQLQSNIEWSQQNTAFEFPTDCPQRDERLPWISADVQQFAPTGMINANEDAYIQNWMKTIFGSQHPDGAFGNIAPDFWPGNPDAGAGWVDMPMLLVYQLWQNYGNTGPMHEYWSQLQKFMSWEYANTSGYLSTLGPASGDWLSPDAPPGPAPGVTPQNLIAAAYFAYDSSVMAKMASEVGDSTDAAMYSNWFAQSKAAFDAKFVQPDGQMINDVGVDPKGVQTEYVMALYMHLLSGSQVSVAGDRLAALIAANGDHLDTGFLGTDELLNVLTDTGHSSVAYSVLTQTTYPSWGYEIKQGATTIWERWDGILPTGGFQDPSENSFDHPAEGGAGNWLYTDLAGIQAATPGYGQIRIDPYLPSGLSHAGGSIDTVRGTVSSNWTQSTDGRISLRVTIPVNSTATVVVPTRSGDQVTESGRSLAGDPGVTVLGTQPDSVTVGLESGSYSFAATPAHGSMPSARS
jgi:alpha-L-rhamnosidase